MLKSWSRILGSLAVLLLLALGLTSGCSSKPKVDWNARVGSYTYDEAVRELGPPDRSTTLSGGGMVADWPAGQAPSFSLGFGVGSYGSHGGAAVGQGVTTGGNLRYLRLTFGADGKLQSWVRTGR